MDKYIGRLLDNRYEILEVIGTGGMAVVYKARCHRLNRLVAIKILKDDFLEDEDFRRRFHAESQAVAQLSHPNIVSVYDVSTSITMEADYIVMELIDGITLKQYLEKKGVLNWKETLHFAMQIAKALEHAHSRGIVHRDIKPHNVMVLKNGSVKVADFGIARMMSQSNTLTREALGSVHYISPEQAKGGRLDNRSDIYSLGVVMYEMMSGRPPYDGDSPVAVAIAHINGGAVMPTLLNPNIPGGLEQIIMKAMAHNIDHRYTTATRMLADMDEFRKDPTILFDYNTPPMDVVTRLQKPAEELPKPPTPARPRPVPARRPTTAARKQQRAAGTQKDRRQAAAARNKTTTIAIISCSLAALLAIMVLLIFGLAGGCSPKEELVNVPYLVGKSLDEIGEIDGLELVTPQYEHDEHEEGIIIGQEPKGGDRVVHGSKLVLVVSKGPATEVNKMPDLVKLTQAEAEGKLDGYDIKLNPKPKEEYHETIPEGCVTRTEPEAGVELTPGQEITLWISKGKDMGTPNLMPDLSGWDPDAAKSYLESLGLNLVIPPFEEKFSEKIEKGQIAETDPAVGVELTEGQTVILHVSKGEQTAKMPPVEGMSLREAEELIASRGFTKIPTVKEVYIDNVEEGTVVKQSHPKNEEIPLSSEIVLEVCYGPKTPKPTESQTVTKDVVIDVSAETKDAACKIVVTRDGKVLFDKEVPQGQSTITIEGQKGSGTVSYIVTPGVGRDGWEHQEDFNG